VNAELTVDLRGEPSKNGGSIKDKSKQFDLVVEDKSESAVNQDPLSRFSSNWENEYVPDYMSENKGANARSAKIVDQSIGVQGKLVEPWN